MGTIRYKKNPPLVDYNYWYTHLENLRQASVAMMVIDPVVREFAVPGQLVRLTAGKDEHVAVLTWPSHGVGQLARVVLVG